MFEALRWRLTAWYLVVFSVVFAVVAVIVFVWVDRRLSNDVQAAVRQVSNAAHDRAVRHDDIAESEDDVRGLLANASLSGSADVFVLLLRPDGTVAANPSDIPLSDLPDLESVSMARLNGAHSGSYHAGDSELRITTLAVSSSDGRLLGFVQAGKSTEEQRASLKTLAIVMAGGGVTGLVLASVGGLFLAGIAIRPVRRSFERQREFVADASHELRTPLAVIRVNAESAAGANAAEAVNDIAAEATYMTRLLDDLLLLAGSDREGIALRIARTDLNEVASGAARGMARLAEDAGVEFTFAPNGSMHVDADAERCREVMLALLDNAVKYTLSGGRIVMRTFCDQGSAVVSISDTGIGVPPGEVERLFDRFYRVDKARSRALGGTGLGLSIAREIVDAHHGSLNIESEPNAGTTVTLRLPLAKNS